MFADIKSMAIDTLQLYQCTGLPTAILSANTWHVQPMCQYFIFVRFTTSSETQGQLVGAREIRNGGGGGESATFPHPH